jgi:hypothetical protein
MKRILCLLLCMMLLALIPLSACAEEPIAIHFSKCLPNQEYSLFILSPGTSEIIPANILFMDQITADSDGKIELLFISPLFQEGTVCLGGKFSDNSASPRFIDSFPIMEKPLNMPGVLTEIGEEAFEGGSFTHVYLGESVQTIGARAFANCNGLRYIYIPDSVTSISYDAFVDSDGVVIGCHENSTAYNFALDNGLPYYILP